MKIERFEDIKAWQEARVSDEVARLTSGFIQYLLAKTKTQATQQTQSTQKTQQTK
jgi:hypothetical protein